MATSRMPDESFDALAHHLPPEKPVGPEGGRPPIGHRPAVRVIWFVLTSGCRWEDVPEELGCSGRTAHRRLRAWEESGVRDRLHLDLLGLLKGAGKLDLDTVIVDGVTIRAFGGGEATGPSPVGRREPGTKRTLMVNKAGVPLAVRTAGANQSDRRRILPLVVGFPRIGGPPGRPEELPDDAYADRGYGSEPLGHLLRRLGIEPHIARRKAPHGSGSGKIRWAVERATSWLKGLRRMRVRYDRLGVIRGAWTTLAVGVICFRILHHDVM